MFPRQVITRVLDPHNPRNIEYWKSRTTAREVLTQLKKFWGLRLLFILTPALITMLTFSRAVPRPSVLELMIWFLGIFVLACLVACMFVHDGLAIEKVGEYLRSESMKAELPAKLEAARIAEVKSVAIKRVARQKRLVSHKPRLVPSYKLRRAI